MWLKYSDQPIEKASLVEAREQSDRLSEYEKPRGCWITDDSEHCWREWCVGESFMLDSLTHKHEVVLDESNILILRSAYDLDDFTQEFAVPKWWGPPEEPRRWRDLCIDWRKVAQKYSGLIITPYQWSRRMHEGYNWYYSWDCASGCIWDTKAILDIRLIAVDREIAKPREAEEAA
jgi:hypothetical protein